MLYKGGEINFPNPKAAQEAGISMIHQELSLIPNLTVAQNIFIGREPRRKFPLFLSDAEINREARKLLDLLGLDVDLQTVVSQKPFNMGYLAVRTAVEAYYGRPVTPYVNTGSELVTRDNMFTREHEKLLFPFADPRGPDEWS